MSATTLLLFGDQTGEPLPTILRLSRLSSASQSLSSFLRKATEGLQHAIFRIPADERKEFPSFNSPLELASALSKQDQPNAALSAALLCIAQVGDVILHVESNPRLLDNSQGEVAVLGICTGLVPALGVSCCRNATELLSIAAELVHVAFQIGLEAKRRSCLIEPSLGSWATLVTNTDVSALQDAIKNFNESCILEPSQHAYLSAVSATSATISGPPSTIKHLFETVPLFQGVKRIPLPISAAFHASHLPQIPQWKIIGSLSQSLLRLPIQHRLLISPSSGLPFAGTTFGEVLVDILEDVLQAPIVFDFYTRGLSKALSTEAGLLTFGPVNSANAISLALEALGVKLNSPANAEMPTPAPSADSSIAIVGMAVRLPGSETLDEFWKILEEGRDLHEKIRPDRFDIESHFDPSGKKKNTTLTPYGVFMDRPGYFDTRLFNMSPREALATDPQQRLMLLTTYEALEMAGYSPNATPSTNTRRIASFMGQTGDDYREVNASQNVDTFFITGGIRAFGPGRLNYHFGWEGGSYSLDTACSSSAAAIQLACSALLSRECDMAVGGGANLLTASDLFAGLSRGGFLSKTGGCKTFDHDADGYVRADGVGVVVLKRLSDAVADRDNILGVIKGISTNHSAEAVSITHPHAPTQERLFESVLNQAQLEANDVDYVEMHGTGTQAGDSTESRSVTNVLARNRPSNKPLYIGTLKPNLGHSEAASGVSSLIKAIMMFRKNLIPPHVGIKGRINQKLPPLAELNTHISFGKTPFLPHPEGDGKRRILINNFDASGGNTSILVEDYPIQQREGVDPRGHHVIPISGKTPNAIIGNTQRLLEYLKLHRDVRIEDVAYTLGARRMHHPIRKAHVASSVEALISSLERAVDDGKWAKASTSQRPPVVFLFTGQGSQYYGMAMELFNTSPTFREHVEDSARICVSHGFESILPLFQHESALSSASPVQMQLAIVSIELALAAWWRSVGVAPSAVLGHSLGEYPALCVAGVLSVSDCLYLVGKRASLMVSRCTPGTHSMLSMQASEERAKALIVEIGASSCEIACKNGPVSTVISGPGNQVRLLQQEAKSRRIKATLLEVPFAFHSSQMDPYLDELASVAAKVHFGTPTVPIASTVLGSVIHGGGVVDGGYFARGARLPVEFDRSVSAILKAFIGQRLAFLEIGPSPTCLGLLRPLVEESLLLPSLQRREGDWKILSSSIAQLFNFGVDVDFRELHRVFEKKLRLLDLPTYAFDLKNYWIQYQGNWAISKGDKTAAAQSPAENSHHKLSATCFHRIESETKDASQVSVTFAADAGEPKLNKALRGHLVNGAGLCSSSVFAAMAASAAEYIQNISDQAGGVSLDVRDMEVHKPLLIQPGNTTQIIRVTATRAIGADTTQIKFSSQSGNEHQDHARCTVVLGSGQAWKSEWAKTAYLVKARIEHLIQSAARGQAHRLLRPIVYKLFQSLVDYNASYQGLREVYMDGYEAAADIKFNTTAADWQQPFWIDSLAHLSGFVLNGAETTPPDSVFISHGWRSMKIVGELSAEKEYQSYVRMQETATKGVMAGDVYFFEGNTVVAVCQDIKFKKIKRSLLNYLLPPPTSTSTKETFQSLRPRTGPAQPKIPIIQVNLADDAPAVDLDSVLRLVASEVGVDVSELVDETEFADLGVDSLLSISITAKLSELLNKSIPAGLFTECLIVRDLKRYIETEFNIDDGISTMDETDAESDIFSPPQSRADTLFTRTGQSVGTPAEPPTHVFKKIIATEIGVDIGEIADDTPLADLGVDSLLSLSILSAIKSQTGHILPSTFLHDHPTLSEIQSALGCPSRLLPPQQLFRALEKAQTMPKASSILLQGSTTSPHPALFLLPDGSGSAGSYVPLPPLNFSGPVYALNSPFIDSPESFTGISLEQVASLFLAEIMRVQPRGPYNLAGWSIGGTYAFEVASQMIQRYSEKVGRLILIDSPCPKTLPALPVETIELLEKLGSFDGLKTRDSKGAAVAARSAIRDGVKKHFEGSVTALATYRPGTISNSESIGEVTAIWARYGVWETVGEEVRNRFGGSGPQGQELNAARDWMMDPRSGFGPGGWDELVPGKQVRCEVVKGDHFSIMRRPGVLELGEKLSEAVSARSL
ncbi:hypothetical protein QBC42DRAFT_220122 [Cladorrhinum samala]|uniref:Polyketide synthase n=1 Tax=Cladorrhinum samala TaxID=585594 RepID=A0AAV9HV28_9PEZI|nr:hypothetical protein QBC42DRAFT_220122 [Cladorrhinum samala]